MFKADSGKRIIRLSQEYAVTLTFHPKVRKFTAEEQYELYAHQTVQYVQQLFPNCKLSLICELTKTFDIHLHGIIQFDLLNIRTNQNMPKMFRDKFRNHSYIGFVLLKVITDDTVWFDYITKSLTDFESDTGKYPVLCDNHKILK